MTSSYSEQSMLAQGESPFRNAVTFAILLGLFWLVPAIPAAEEGENGNKRDLLAVNAKGIAARAFNTVQERLNKIKPEDTDEFAYQVEMAPPVEALPEDLQLDLVYKIGHYQWAVVALRFERRSGQSEVDVTEVVHGSAFDFWKQFVQSVEEARGSESNQDSGQRDNGRAKYFDDHDFYRVRRGRIPTGIFDSRLIRGLLYWRSSISRVDLRRPNGMFAYSHSNLSCSADGLIVFRLSESGKDLRTILEGEDILVAGDLTARIPGSPHNYRSIRAHLFWEGFHEYMAANPLSEDIPREEAVSMLVKRLAEPTLTSTYRDYFRRSLYVKILGELGSPKAIPALREAARLPRLRGWDTALRQDVKQAIARIEFLSNASSSNEDLPPVQEPGEQDQ